LEFCISRGGNFVAPADLTITLGGNFMDTFWLILIIAAIVCWFTGGVGPGVDLIDISSGALVPTARIPVAKGCQVPFARRIRDEAGIATGAVELITEVGHANEIITGRGADLVFLARELLREPYWALKAQQQLGAEPTWPTQYGYAIKRRSK
jgi:2,4-dienoyl-CoA reductase-like NADH-dependent reductase (Old Yellow Enzyme family)